MANKTISQLVLKDSPVVTDEMEVQATGGGASNKVTIQGIVDLAIGSVAEGQVAFGGTMGLTGDDKLKWDVSASELFIGSTDVDADFPSRGQVNVKTDANGIGEILETEPWNIETGDVTAVFNVIAGRFYPIAAYFKNQDDSGNSDIVQLVFSASDGERSFGTFEFQASGAADGTCWFGVNFDSGHGNADKFLIFSDGTVLPGSNGPDDNAHDIGSPSSPIVGGGPLRFRTGYFGTSVVTPLVQSTPVALATLGSAATAGAGTRAFINDALSLGTWGAAAVDGGSITKPVWSDGANWLNG